MLLLFHIPLPLVCVRRFSFVVLSFTAMPRWVAVVQLDPHFRDQGRGCRDVSPVGFVSKLPLFARQSQPFPCRFYVGRKVATPSASDSGASLSNRSLCSKSDTARALQSLSSAFINLPPRRVSEKRRRSLT